MGENHVSKEDWEMVLIVHIDVLYIICRFMIGRKCTFILMKTSHILTLRPGPAFTQENIVIATVRVLVQSIFLMDTYQVFLDTIGEDLMGNNMS